VHPSESFAYKFASYAGEVTVDVTATSGPGNLLGNLLTGVSNLLNGSNNPLATQVLNQLVGDVLALL